MVEFLCTCSNYLGDNWVTSQVLYSQRSLVCRTMLRECAPARGAPASEAMPWNSSWMPKLDDSFSIPSSSASTTVRSVMYAAGNTT